MEVACIKRHTPAPALPIFFVNANEIQTSSTKAPKFGKPWARQRRNGAGGKELQGSAAHGVAGDEVMPRRPARGRLQPRCKELEGRPPARRGPRGRQGPASPQPRRPSLRAGLGRERPARTHLASSSSGVSGHFAAKWAVTALDAEAVRAPSSEKHSAVEPRSSRTTSAAFAMARRGKREPLGPRDHSPQPPRYSRLLPPRGRPLPVGGARVRYSEPGPGGQRAHARPAPAPSRAPPGAGFWSHVGAGGAGSSLAAADALADLRSRPLVLGRRLRDAGRGVWAPGERTGIAAV